MVKPHSIEEVREGIDELNKKLKNDFGIEADIREMNEKDVYRRVFDLLPELEIYSILLKRSTNINIFHSLADAIVHSIALLKILSEKVYVSKNMDLFDAYISSLRIIAKNFGADLDEKVKKNESMVSIFRIDGGKDD